jgi:hypothetical protein
LTLPGYSARSWAALPWNMTLAVPAQIAKSFAARRGLLERR